MRLVERPNRLDTARRTNMNPMVFSVARTKRTSRDRQDTVNEAFTMNQTCYLKVHFCV